MRTEITFGGHTYPLREPMGLDDVMGAGHRPSRIALPASA